MNSTPSQYKSTPKESSLAPSLALKLSFYREIARQYTSESREEDSEDNEDRLWSVLGSMDFMIPKSVTCLSELYQTFGPDNAIDDNNEIAQINELILLPHVKSNCLRISDSNDHLIFSKALIGDPTDAENFFITAVIRLSLSSAVFEVPESPLNISAIFEQADEIVEIAKDTIEKLKETKPLIWRTLGGPELVITTAIKSESHIQAVLDFVTSLRRQKIDTWLEKHKEIKGLFRELFRSHVFSRATVDFCYLANKEQEIANQFKQNFDPNVNRLVITTRLEVDPGHEDFVLSRLRRDLSNVPQIIRNPAVHKSIQIQFSTFSDAILSLLAIRRNGQQPYRDITATRTAVGLKSNFQNLAEETSDHNSKQNPTVDVSTANPTETQEHSKVFLSHELKKKLDTTKKTLEYFRDNFGFPSIAFRLKQLFVAIEHCLYRNDRATSIRDLLPFVDQLSRCIMTDAVWGNYLKSKGKASDLKGAMRDFNRLTDHLWRALQNRTEYRIPTRDPTVPTTLEYGASKLVNAYTVATWLASELVLNSTKQFAPRSNDCGSERFGVCVSVNSTGRVSCEEVFSELRRELELEMSVSEGSDETSSEICHLSQRGNSDWNFPLLLLTISGPAIFRPEITLTHCLHEVAEFGEWYRLPQTTILHEKLIAYCLTVFERIIVSWAYENPNNLDPEDVFQRIELLIQSSIAIRELDRRAKNDRSNQFDSEDIREIASYQLKSCSLRDIFRILEHGLQNAVKDKRIKQIATTLRNSTGRKISLSSLDASPWPHYESLQRSDYKGIDKAIKFGDELTEFIADFAMICSLKSITLKNTKPTESKNNIKADLNRIYISIIESLNAWQSIEVYQRSLVIIIRRWLIQFLIHTEDEVGQGFDNFWEEVNKLAKAGQLKLPQNEIDHTRQDISRDFQIGVIDILRDFIQPLRKIRQEWDKQSIFYEPLEHDHPNNQPIDDLLREFADLWNTTRNEPIVGAYDIDRYKFVERLWSKSCRLYLDKFVSKVLN